MLDSTRSNSNEFEFQLLEDIIYVFIIILYIFHIFSKNVKSVEQCG